MKIAEAVRLAVCGVFLLWLPCAVVAQNYRAQVRGIVTDDTGAALPGAEIKLLNVSTNVEVTRQSDSAGCIFSISSPRGRIG